MFLWSSYKVMTWNELLVLISQEGKRKINKMVLEKKFRIAYVFEMTYPCVDLSDIWTLWLFDPWRKLLKRSLVSFFFYSPLMHLNCPPSMLLMIGSVARNLCSLFCTSNSESKMCHIQMSGTLVQALFAFSVFLLYLHRRVRIEQERFLQLTGFMGGAP